MNNEMHVTRWMHNPVKRWHRIEFKYQIKSRLRAVDEMDHQDLRMNVLNVLCTGYLTEVEGVDELLSVINLEQGAKVVMSTQRENMTRVYRGKYCDREQRLTYYHGLYEMEWTNFAPFCGKGVLYWEYNSDFNTILHDLSKLEYFKF